METIEVRAAARDDHYTIRLGAGALRSLGDSIDRGRYTSVFLLTDATVEPLWGALCRDALDVTETITIAPGESAKTLDTVTAVWTALDAAGADRRSLLLNLGGGVVGDLGGFAAATYQRGIDFAQLPTTLLAQVDASVGGKVGVNFGGHKNRVGAFASPVAVVIDPDVLATLDARVYRSGFAEMLKHGLIRDGRAFDALDPALATDAAHPQLAGHIARAVAIKKDVVERDRLERGERKVLNFGHTVGHAVESLALRTEAPLLHGEAVAIGMVAEARLSALPATDLEAIDARIAAFGLPTRIPTALATDAIIEATRADKKRSGGRVAWSLLDAIGSARVDADVREAALREVIEALR